MHWREAQGRQPRLRRRQKVPGSHGGQFVVPNRHLASSRTGGQRPVTDWVSRAAGIGPYQPARSILSWPTFPMMSTF